jgi:hypothetical protein
MPLTTPPTREIPLYARDPATGETFAVKAAPGPARLNDLTDVDTATTAPVDGNGLRWSDTATQWVPQPVWGSWSGTQAEYDALGVYDDNVLYAVI